MTGWEHQFMHAPYHNGARPYRARTSQRFWKFRPIDRNDRARILHLAERLNARTRQPGQHGGCLKDSGLQILRALLFQFLDCRTGRLDPSLDTLARVTGHCRATVVAALKRLRAAGFVSWVQRVALVRIDGLMRPQQITNGYQIGTGLAPAGFMPSQWRDAYGSKNCSEPTEPYFFTAPAVPEDDALRLALKRLARATGWSEDKLKEVGLS